NYPFTRGLTPEEKQNNSACIQRQLLHCFETLKKEEVALAVLVCNTLHLELSHISMEPLQLFSIPHLVLKKIEEKKGKRLLLLATENTCRSSLYNQNGITIFCLPQKEQRIVEEAIDHILEGKIVKKDALLLEQLINAFPEAIDGVILGCTDLPVLHHHHPLSLNVPIYDSVKIPATTILRYL
ncbi:MAG TPA: aspartate/glutamate racemase family protein, partial [Chlamydiales bacterium]|nr:aspartate/glutamate racemase family protein [Chlamydiales bacterium]